MQTLESLSIGINQLIQHKTQHIVVWFSRTTQLSDHVRNYLTNIEHEIYFFNYNAVSDVMALIQSLGLVKKEYKTLCRKLRFVAVRDINDLENADVVSLLDVFSGFGMVSDFAMKIFVEDDAVMAATVQLVSQFSATIFVTRERSKLISFSTWATLVSVGRKREISIEETLKFMYGITIQHLATVKELRKYVSKRVSRCKANLIRFVTFAEDNIYDETLLALRDHTDAPLLIVSSDPHCRDISEGIYNYPRVKCVFDPAEIVSFGSMTQLDWCPDLSKGRLSECSLNGHLVVKSLKCRNLYPKDSNGLSDPFVIIKHHDDAFKYKSPVIRETLNPDWENYTIDWPLDCGINERIVVQVWDWDFVSNDFEGLVTFTPLEMMKEMSQNSPSLEKTFQLRPRDKKRKKSKALDLETDINTTYRKITGTITITFCLVSPCDQDMNKMIFGVPLEKSFENTFAKGVEHFTDSVMKQILKRGTSVVGVFRIPGSSSVVKSLEEEIDRTCVLDYLNEDILNLASALKLYFRTLPEPLWPNSFRAEANELYDNPDPEFAASILLQFDELSKLVWLKLLLFLHTLSKFEATTRMSSSNLSICLAPTLFISNDANPLEMLEFTKVSSGVMEFLIRSATQIISCVDCTDSGFLSFQEYVTRFQVMNRSINQSQALRLSQSQ
eukprot:TRINITY_DN2998_c0_g1_i1.p1 TRINITY_DN2998_c0_g1~~TRINITY_DN2998_c0_g1_i1.p1  ORF type:complete len:670 (-),score=119.13 TRINITY_DN2998_c0_g1_i1:1762-3771(-)